MPDVLIFCPVFQLAAETLDAVMAMRWSGGRCDRLFGEDLATPPGHQNHLAQYLRAWQMARSGGYDMLLCVESDIVPPLDAALWLWEQLRAGADAAIGLYVFRGSARVNALLPDGRGGMGPSLSEAPGGVMARHWGRVVEVAGQGFGCLAVSRRALDILPRLEERTYCDRPWWDDFGRAGLRAVCDSAVVCGHVHGGTIAYPTQKGGVWVAGAQPELRETGESVTVRMKVSVASPYGCPSAGDEIVLPTDVAISWQNAGYCEITSPVARKARGRVLPAGPTGAESAR